MRLRVGDVRLFFDVDGAGLVVDGPSMRERPTLVLLSGGPGFDHTVFKPAYSRLADVAQVVYLDFRGHGRSDQGDRSRWTVDVFAEDVRAFCDALGIEKPVVLGWSFGGMVAMRYAARHPEHPAKLILQSTRPRLDLDGLVRAFGRLGGDEAARAARAFWSTGGPEALARYGEVCAPLYGPSQADADELARTTYNLELLSDPGSVIRHVDLRPELAGVRCPTLVIAGDADPWGSVDAAEEIVAALPGPLVRYEKFPGAGHHIHHDDPVRLFEVVREFLAVPGHGTAVPHPRAGSVMAGPA
ncbi:alpha/beta fold hydrolase [Geodermatophilus sp. SYSU D01186]